MAYLIENPAILIGRRYTNIRKLLQVGLSPEEAVDSYIRTHPFEGRQKAIAEAIKIPENTRTVLESCIGNIAGLNEAIKSDATIKELIEFLKSKNIAVKKEHLLRYQRQYLRKLIAESQKKLICPDNYAPHRHLNTFARRDAIHLIENVQADNLALQSMPSLCERYVQPEHFINYLLKINLKKFKQHFHDYRSLTSHVSLSYIFTLLARSKHTEAELQQHIATAFDFELKNWVATELIRRAYDPDYFL